MLNHEFNENNIFQDYSTLNVYNSNIIDQEGNLESNIKKITFEGFNNLRNAFMNLKKNQKEDQESKKLELQLIDSSISPNAVNIDKSSINFPRFKKLPSEKPLTKWERFAKEKGIIKNKKRSKMVWSDEKNDYVRRLGYNSKNQLKDKLDIIREVKPGQEFVDQFKEEKMNKKLDKKRQNLKELKNLELQNRKKEIKSSLNINMQSTASMGKFDKKKIPIKKKIVKKAKNTSIKDELTRDKDLLKSIFK